jgi:hypothetical protein
MRYTPLLLFLLLFSCDRPECTNTNPVFDKYAAETNEYKAELIRQLNARTGKADFWIDKYSKQDSTEYMSIFVQANGLCAKGILDITNTLQLKQYKKVKGMSYSGAGLSGLKFRIDSLHGDYNFIFESVGSIID